MSLGSSQEAVDFYNARHGWYASWRERHLIAKVAALGLDCGDALGVLLDDKERP